MNSLKMFRNKIPFRTNYSSIFSSKVQNLTVFSIIYMIRIGFSGPGRIKSEGFLAARYARSSGARLGNMVREVVCPRDQWLADVSAGKVFPDVID